MHIIYVRAIIQLGNSPHTHLHASTPHHQTTQNKHKFSPQKARILKISNWKAKYKVEKTYLGGANDERKQMLDDERMQDKAQG